VAGQQYMLTIHRTAFRKYLLIFSLELGQAKFLAGLANACAVAVHRVREKMSLEYFRHDFIKYRSIFKNFSLSESPENLQ